MIPVLLSETAREAICMDGSERYASPEVKLLLCCARTQVDAERIRTLVCADLDWERLMASARKHRILQLLAMHLPAYCSDAVPKNYLEQLRYFYAANAAFNQVMAQKLQQVLKRFVANGIDVIPFKGPVLASVGYGDSALRQFNDLDLLLACKPDIALATELLNTQGYGCDLSWLNMQLQRKGRGKGVTFVDDDNLAAFEVHWEVFPRMAAFALKSEHIWARSEEVVWDGMTIRTFSSEDMLLYLCAHGTAHRWKTLQCVCDVAEWLRAHPQMDWSTVLERARAGQCERQLFLGLLLAAELLDAVIPAEVEHRIRHDPKVSSLTTHVYRQLFPEGGSPKKDMAYYLFKTRTRERNTNRVAYLLYLVAAAWGRLGEKARAVLSTGWATSVLSGRGAERSIR